MSNELWYHHDISRVQSEELILAGGGKDGRFLVRNRPEKEGEYIMALVYGGRATHHLMVQGDNGFWTVNKKQYGECRTMEETISLLSKPCKGWPVVLSDPVLRSASAAPPPALVAANRAPDTRTAAPQQQQQPPQQPQQPPQQQRAPDANAVRAQTHRPAESVQAQNPTPSHAQQPQQQQQHQQSYTQPQQQQQQPANPPHAAVQRADALLSTTSNNTAQKQQKILGDADEPFNHGDISRVEAEDILTEYCKAKYKGDITGVWMIRNRPPKENTDGNMEYVILVGFSGRPTHHLCQQQADGSFTVNGKETGARTLRDVIDFLKTKPRFWPVDLKDYVPRKDKPASATASVSPQPVITPTVASTPAYTQQQQPQQQQQQQQSQQQLHRPASFSIPPPPVTPPSPETPPRTPMHKSAQDSLPPPSPTDTTSSKVRPNPVGAADQERDEVRATTADQRKPPPYHANGPTVAPPPGRRLSRKYSASEIRSLFDGMPKIPLELYRENRSQSFGFGISDGHPPEITSVAEEGVAWHAGMYPGDLIVQVQDKQTLKIDRDTLLSMIASAETELYLLVVRPSMREGRDDKEDHYTPKPRKLQGVSKLPATPLDHSDEFDFPEDGYYTDE